MCLITLCYEAAQAKNAILNNLRAGDAFYHNFPGGFFVVPDREDWKNTEGGRWQ